MFVFEVNATVSVSEIEANYSQFVLFLTLRFLAQLNTSNVIQICRQSSKKTDLESKRLSYEETLLQFKMNK